MHNLSPGTEEEPVWGRNCTRQDIREDVIYMDMSRGTAVIMHSGAALAREKGWDVRCGSATELLNDSRCHGHADK